MFLKKISFSVFSCLRLVGGIPGNSMVSESYSRGPAPCSETSSSLRALFKRQKKKYNGGLCPDPTDKKTGSVLREEEIKIGNKKKFASGFEHFKILALNSFGSDQAILNTLAFITQEHFDVNLNSLKFLFDSYENDIRKLFGNTKEVFSNILHNIYSDMPKELTKKGEKKETDSIHEYFKLYVADVTDLTFLLFRSIVFNLNEFFKKELVKLSNLKYYENCLNVEVEDRIKEKRDINYVEFFEFIEIVEDIKKDFLLKTKSSEKIVEEADFNDIKSLNEGITQLTTDFVCDFINLLVNYKIKIQQTLLKCGLDFDIIGFHSGFKEQFSPFVSEQLKKVEKCIEKLTADCLQVS